MEKHFELTEEFRLNILGIKVFRIKATKSFRNVNKGDLGGYVEKKENISGNAWVYGNAEVSGDARVYGNAEVSGNAEVYGNAWVYGNARVSGDARVYGNARVSGDAEVYGNAWVSGDAWVYGNARVYGNADFCVFQKFGSSNRSTTFFKSKKGIEVKCGCFKGSLKQFEKQVKETHKGSKYEKEYLAIIDVVKIKFNID